MRHLKKGRKLGRTYTHRKSLLGNMATSLFDKGRIITTTAKAKELRGVAERLITHAKKGTLNSRRIAAKTVKNETVLKKLFDSIAPEFSARSGGYTRVLKLGKQRTGDAAELSIIELIGYVPKAKSKEKKGKAEKAKEASEAKAE